MTFSFQTLSEYVFKLSEDPNFVSQILRLSGKEESEASAAADR
jgi:hypothetical protein